MSDNLKAGDLLEIKRKLGYSHWALYIGNGRVIHFNCPPDTPWYCVLFCENKGIVEEADLSKVIDGCEWYINNSKDKEFQALPVDEIIQRGNSMVKNRDYNIFFFNCEHFCSYCRYGVKKSDQVDNATFILVKLLVFVVDIASELCKKENNAIRDDSCRKQNSPTFETTGYADVVKKCCQLLGDVTKTHSSCERTGEVVSFGGRCIELVLEARKEVDFLKHPPRNLTPFSLPELALQAYGLSSTFCSFLGLGLQMFGCVLKRTTHTAEIGDTVDKIGCTLKKWGTKGITDTIVSIFGLFVDLTLEQKKKLAAGVDLVLLVLIKLPTIQLQLLPFLMDVFLFLWKHRNVISEMSTELIGLLNSFMNVFFYRRQPESTGS